MTRVLGFYLAREIVFATLLVLVAFLGLFAFFDFINELDSIGRDGYEVHHALIYVAMIMPGRVYELMPVVVLIGTLYALTSLARQSEITVMRASGMSTANLLAMLGSIGMVFVVFTFVFGEYLAPPAERAAQQWRLTATGSAVSQQLRSGLWIKDAASFINVRTVQPDRTMENIRIFAFDSDDMLASISEAQRGQYDESVKTWRLTDVVQTRFLGDSTEVVSLPQIDWQSELSPEILSVLIVAPERMALGTLYAYISHLRDNRQNTGRFEIALWKKIVYPFAVLVMIALAVPFALGHDRVGTASVKVFMGVMLGVGFHLLNGLFSNLGVIHSWSPALAALTPSLLFLIAAAVMMFMVERR